MFTLIYEGERYVIVNLSEPASNASLDAIGSMMAGGQIEVLSGDGTTLAVLKLSNPATRPASGGELVFNTIGREDAALAAGTAELARILAMDGNEVMSVDVGDTNSDATIRLTSTSIDRGASVSLSSFRLAMP